MKEPLEADEDYGEDALEEKDLIEMKHMFDKEVWPQIKQETKDVTKKEACFMSFILGFGTMKKITEEQMKEAQAMMSNMSPEDINKMLNHDIEKQREKDSPTQKTSTSQPP